MFSLWGEVLWGVCERLMVVVVLCVSGLWGCVAEGGGEVQRSGSVLAFVLRVVCGLRLG